MENSARNSAPGRPFARGADARRHTGPKPKAGRPTDEFKAEMRRLASSPETLARLKAILATTTDDDVFLKALAFAADRGYGKAQQHVDHTSSGEPLTREAIATMSATEIRTEIGKRMRIV